VARRKKRRAAGTPQGPIIGDVPASGTSSVVGRLLAVCF